MARDAQKLLLDALDVRLAPSVTAAVVEGSLVVSGAANAPSGLVKVVGTGERSFRVFDGDTKVGDYAGVTKNVGVALTDAKDVLVVDLGGFTLGGGVKVQTGGGDNKVFVGNGKVAADVTVTGGGKADAVELAKLAVGGGVSFAGGAGADRLAANGLKAAGLKTDGVESVAFGPDSSATKDVTVAGGNEAVVGGFVGGLFTFTGAATGADAVTIGKTAVLAKGAAITTAGGNDLVQIDGAVGPAVVGADAPPVLVINTGAGNDTVRFGETAKVAGRSKVSLGAGDDTFALAPAAKVGAVWADGGEGKDLFVGSKTATGLTLVNFEYYGGGDGKK